MVMIKVSWAVYSETAFYGNDQTSAAPTNGICKVVTKQTSKYGSVRYIIDWQI